MMIKIIAAVCLLIVTTGTSYAVDSGTEVYARSFAWILAEPSGDSKNVTAVEKDAPLIVVGKSGFKFCTCRLL